MKYEYWDNLDVFIIGNISIGEWTDIRAGKTAAKVSRRVVIGLYAAKIKEAIKELAYEIQESE